MIKLGSCALGVSEVGADSGPVAALNCVQCVESIVQSDHESSALAGAGGSYVVEIVKGVSCYAEKEGEGSSQGQQAGSCIFCVLGTANNNGCRVMQRKK